MRKSYGLTMKALKSVSKHGTVDLAKHILPNLDYAIGSNTQEVRIKGSVMDLAHRQAIGNDWLAAPFGAITDDVGGVEEPDVPDAADGACS